jgi:hypothetical protein
MNRRHFLRLTLSLLAWAVVPLSAPAKDVSNKPPGLSSSLGKVFGKNSAFSAKVQMVTKDSGGKEIMEAPVDFAFTGGSIYWSMDLAEVKGTAIPPEAAAQLKQLGMSLTVFIIKPDAKYFHLVYPELKSFVEMPIAEAEQAAAKAQVKTERLGEEAIGTSKCVKNKVTVTTDGKAEELFTWNAPEQKDFPIRVEFMDRDKQVTLNFKEVKLEKPEAKLFAPPAGFTKYDNVDQILKAIMLKRFGAPPAQ